MKIAYYDELVSIWKRTTVEIPDDMSVEEFADKLQEDDDIYSKDAPWRVLEWEYMPETEQYGNYYVEEVYDDDLNLVASW